MAGGLSACVRSVKLSPTEQRNPRSAKLDKLPIGKAIRLMLAEDLVITRALLKQQRQIQRGVEMVAAALRRGGRLFYVGAGTSGRLGVLDASECPPTFRTSPEQVQAIIAGGQTALSRAVEGAEDDSAAGGRAIQFRGVTARDVWGALVAAKQRRARTILVCCNPFLRIARAAKPDLVIAPNVGPEVLTGSTRLKAGTATKLILNMLTTLSMVRLGKAVGNLMADLNPSSAKLRDRAVRTVQTMAGVDYAAARAVLERNGWRVKNAAARLGRKGSHPTA
jgi:N-acetylmuramic acid 6-phosphate etherase